MDVVACGGQALDSTSGFLVGERLDLGRPLFACHGQPFTVVMRRVNSVPLMVAELRLRMPCRSFSLLSFSICSTAKSAPSACTVMAVCLPEIVTVSPLTTTSSHVTNASSMGSE